MEKRNGFAVNIITERSFCRALSAGRERVVVLMLVMERRGLMKEGQIIKKDCRVAGLDDF